MIVLNIAGVNVGVENKYPLLQWGCEEHITTASPEFVVSASEDEIREDYEANERKFKLKDCESNCLYRKICFAMPRYDAFLLHAAAVALDGAGYAFTAPGGTGKSTHIGYWMKEFGGRAVIVNGDKPIIRLMKDRFYICGTPWRGKECLGNSDIVPLKGICLLERGLKNEIRPADNDTIIDRIFNQVLLPDEPELVVKQLELMDRLIESVPVYVLKCSMSQEAALTAYKGMN
ncbi:MAG: hypothetical protein LUD81_05665 [Clostridiales bacterium]|nr:hypothetical protein [Clostridiales bacterium]